MRVELAATLDRADAGRQTEELAETRATLESTEVFSATFS
jgi:hypothetical protein